MTDENKDVFDQDTKDTNSNNDNNASETQKLVDELVGEGKKYKTIEDLARSRLEADKFIDRLKDENKGIREDLEKLETQSKDSKTLEDLMELVKKATSSDDEGNQPEFTQEELKKIIQDEFVNLQTDAQRKRNRQEANDNVISRFKGDKEKAAEFIKERAGELGMDVKTLADMAESSPKAFTQLLGLSATKPNESDSTTHNYQDINTETGKFIHGDNQQTFAYFEKMRRESPSEYWKPATQQQLLKLAEEAHAKGEDFYTTQS